MQNITEINNLCNMPSSYWCDAGRSNESNELEDQSWEKLKNAVIAVHTESPVEFSMEELYSVRNFHIFGCSLSNDRIYIHKKAVEITCGNNLADVLYKKLRDVCEGFAKETLENIVKLF